MRLICRAARGAWSNASGGRLPPVSAGAKMEREKSGLTTDHVRAKLVTYKARQIVIRKRELG